MNQVMMVNRPKFFASCVPYYYLIPALLFYNSTSEQLLFINTYKVISKFQPGMITEQLNTEIKQILQQKVHPPVSTISFTSVGGGSINDTYKITIPGNQPFFLKLNSQQKFPSLFTKEKNGLHFIAEQKIIRTPAVVDCQLINDQQILILEWIEQRMKSQSFWKTFGEKLASLHQITNEYFGFTENNYMGALPQLNNRTSTWTSFFIHHRLQPQVHLGERNRLLESKHIHQFEKLYEKMDLIFDSEKPSLLHGDLWSGNFLCDEHSQPVLIDPAVYFGHRSMDLAMTTLFGGFDKSFYDAYHYHFSLPTKYLEQWDVCNLYPLLIHLNLFGSSYLHDIAAILRKFIA